MPHASPLKRRGRTSLLPRLWRSVTAEPAGYLIGAAATAASTGLGLLARHHATLEHLLVVYLLGAVVVATRYGVAVSSFTIAASALCFDYFNIPPLHRFALPDLHSVLTLGALLLAAIVVCALLQRLRHQSAIARASEARTLALCELSLDLSEAALVSELPGAAERHLVKLFGGAPRVLLRAAAGDVTEGLASEAERELVVAALALGELRTEETLAGTLAVQPIASGSELHGAIMALLGAPAAERNEQQLLLAASADRIAVAVDRLALGDAARRAHIEIEAERLRNELLSALSHDLRTPLASILTAGTTLLNPAGASGGVRRELLETIVDETERLNRLVTNLLEVTRLESGRVELHKAPDDLEELVYGVLARLSARLEGRAIQVDAPAAMPLVSMDAVLVDQVLVNIVENVLRYTPAGSPVTVRLRASAEEVAVEVADRGPGIASDEREKVFEKFYRGSQARHKDGGSGLGLTICRAVARAHGGRIVLGARAGGGTSVELVLPATAPLERRVERGSRLRRCEVQA